MGKPISWHNLKTDQGAVWLMNGTKLVSAGSAIQGPRMKVGKSSARESIPVAQT